MMTIAVLTNDAYLHRYIELTLGTLGDVKDYVRGMSADVLIEDIDFATAEDFHGRRIRLCRDGAEGAHMLPLARGALAELISSTDAVRLYVDESARSAVLDGREIRLTAQEYSLLSFLLSKCGDYASRAEISEAVWGGASDGLINIYIHYLREKLETQGERIILSSRSHGYRISEKYVR